MVIKRYVPIKDLIEGERYDQVFMISSQPQELRAKSSFVKVQFSDMSGRIEGVIWDATLKRAKHIVKPGSFILVKCKITNYGGRKTFECNKDDVTIYSGEPDNMSDYVPGINAATLECYKDELRNFIDEIDDPEYRDLIKSADSRLHIIDNILAESTYGLSGPLAYRGGLLVQVVHAIRVSRGIVDGCQEAEAPLNLSLITLGCIFRNMGWSSSTVFSGNLVQPKDAYYLTGLYRASFRILNDMALHVESDLSIKFNPNKIYALENMCNKLEEIKTLEGKIVGQACNAVDMMFHGEFLLRKRDDSSWVQTLFTQHIKN